MDSKFIDDDTLNVLFEKIKIIHQVLKDQRESNIIRDKYPDQRNNQPITDKQIMNLFNEITSLYNNGIL